MNLMGGWWWLVAGGSPPWWKAFPRFFVGTQNENRAFCLWTTLLRRTTDSTFLGKKKRENRQKNPAFGHALRDEGRGTSEGRGGISIFEFLPAKSRSQFLF